MDDKVSEFNHHKFKDMRTFTSYVHKHCEIETAQLYKQCEKESKSIYETNKNNFTAMKTAINRYENELVFSHPSKA